MAKKAHNDEPAVVSSSSSIASSEDKMSLLRTFGSLISRSRIASALGKSFNGKRDYYNVFGYKHTLLYEDLLAKYVRQGIASRIVEAPAQALWDNPPQISSNNEEWNQAWQTLIVKNNLWNSLLKVDNLCGLGRYSTMLIGVSGVGGTDTRARIPRSGRLRRVLYFQVYSQQSSQIQSVSSDQNSPQYLLPEMYTMYPFRQNEGDVATKLGFDVSVSSFNAHYTRVLHVAENTLENSVFGSPRLERVYNDLDDLLKVSGGTSETFWLTSNRGMQIDVDKDTDLSPEDAKDLNDEVEEYMHKLRRFIRTRGVKIQNLGADTPEPEQTFQMLISLISGATGIPQRILIGAEAGQLASEQDRANWAERIEARRTEFGEPVIIYPLISKLTNLGVLPQPEGLEITIEWPDAYQLTPLESAQQSAQHARSATNFARAIDIMENLNRSTEPVPEQLDEDGNPIPGTGTEGQEGAGLKPLITIEEARRFMDLDAPTPRIDDPNDLSE